MHSLFDLHCILQASVPTLSAELTDFSAIEPLDELASLIIAAGTKVIYSYVVQPTDIYLYQEAIRYIVQAIFHELTVCIFYRLKFAPSFGYQWLSVGSVFSTFPFANDRGNCASLTPPCTTAFNSSISLVPSTDVNLTSDLWRNVLLDAYNQVDPVKLPSAFIVGSSSQLGELSKGHDGAVAIILGAMKIIKRTETVTGPKLATMIRTVSTCIQDHSVAINC